MWQQKIKILRDDITQLSADIIVNAANHSLLGGRGVDGAIHRKAGPELLTACRQLNGCETGKAKITRAYGLKAKYIIHTVGPLWQGGDHNETTLLASCYRESLVLAAQYHAQTIAFPAISCGIYGYPIAKACDIALKTLRQFLKIKSSIKLIYLVCYDEAVFNTYSSLMNASQSRE